MGALSGKNVGYITDLTDNFTKQAQSIKNATKKNTVSPYSKIDTVADDIISDKIDAFFCYEHHALELVKNDQLEAHEVVNVPKERYVMLVLKSNDQLQSILNDKILDITNDGTLDEIRSRYTDEGLYMKSVAASAQAKVDEANDLASAQLDEVQAEAEAEVAAQQETSDTSETDTEVDAEAEKAEFDAED
jgi:hypothetical protein